jgi:hypothetical protein
MRTDGQTDRYDVTNGRFSQFFESFYKDGAVISLHAIEEPGLETNVRVLKLFTTVDLEICLRGL